MKKYQIVASERDGLSIKNIVINLNARDNMSEDDILKAIRKSCADFCKTGIGRDIYEEHFGAFNYGDFEAWVPNDICEKYGITKVSEIDRIVIDDLDFDEQLVDKAELESYYDSQNEKERE